MKEEQEEGIQCNSISMNILNINGDEMSGERFCLRNCFGNNIRFHNKRDFNCVMR